VSNLSGFSLFLLIFGSPVLIASLIGLVNARELIYRDIRKGLAKFYEWTVPLLYYWEIVLAMWVMMYRYPFFGSLMLVMVAFLALYTVGFLKGRALGGVNSPRIDYVILALNVLIYLVIPAYVVLFKEGISVSAVIYFAIAILYFGYSFSVLREVHRIAQKRGVTQNYWEACESSSGKT